MFLSPNSGVSRIILPMSAESWRAARGLAVDFRVLFPGRSGGGRAGGAHAWLECRAWVGAGPSGDVHLVTAAHGGAQAPSLKALGLVRPSRAPAFVPPPRAARLPQKRRAPASWLSEMLSSDRCWFCGPALFVLTLTATKGYLGSIGQKNVAGPSRLVWCCWIQLS